MVDSHSFEEIISIQTPHPPRPVQNSADSLKQIHHTAGSLTPKRGNLNRGGGMRGRGGNNRNPPPPVYDNSYHIPVPNRFEPLWHSGNDNDIYPPRHFLGRGRGGQRRGPGIQHGRAGRHHPHTHPWPQFTENHNGGSNHIKRGISTNSKAKDRKK